MLLVAVIRLDNCVFFWSVWYIQALDGWSHVTLWGTQWVSHLPALFPVSGLLGFVGFDAADVVWSTFNQCAHQVIGLSLKEVQDHNDVKLMNTPNAPTELSALRWLLKDSKHIHCLFKVPYPHTLLNTHLYFASCSCGSTLLFSV